MTSLFADLQRALALMQTKDWQGAFDLYNQAVEHISARAYKLCLYNNRGWAAYNLKHYACAIFDASVAVELSAKQRFPLALRSRGYEAIGLRSPALRVSALFSHVCMSMTSRASRAGFCIFFLLVCFTICGVLGHVGSS